MDKQIAKQIWDDACEAQRELCEQRAFDLLNTDSDPEIWHDKISKTKLAKFEPEEHDLSSPSKEEVQIKLLEDKFRWVAEKKIYSFCYS